ncbi:J domain-containing protein [bacterium]|nr:J domain-containing protein [bacterium]
MKKTFILLLFAFLLPISFFCLAPVDVLDPIDTLVSGARPESGVPKYGVGVPGPGIKPPEGLGASVSPTGQPGSPDLGPSLPEVTKALPPDQPASSTALVTRDPGISSDVPGQGVRSETGDATQEGPSSIDGVEIPSGPVDPGESVARAIGSLPDASGLPGVESGSGSGAAAGEAKEEEPEEMADDVIEDLSAFEQAERVVAKEREEERVAEAMKKHGIGHWIKDRIDRWTGQERQLAEAVNSIIDAETKIKKIRAEREQNPDAPFWKKAWSRASEAYHSFRSKWNRSTAETLKVYSYSGDTESLLEGVKGRRVDLEYEAVLSNGTTQTAEIAASFEQAERALKRVITESKDKIASLNKSKSELPGDPGYVPFSTESAYSAVARAGGFSARSKDLFYAVVKGNRVNLFEMLGLKIDPNTGRITVPSERDCSKAYRRLSLRLHPDKAGDTPAATEKFKELGMAKDFIDSLNNGTISKDDFLSALMADAHCPSVVHSGNIVAMVALEQKQLDYYRAARQKLADKFFVEAKYIIKELQRLKEAKAKMKKAFGMMDARTSGAQTQPGRAGTPVGPVY